MHILNETSVDWKNGANMLETINKELRNYNWMDFEISNGGMNKKLFRYIFQSEKLFFIFLCNIVLLPTVYIVKGNYGENNYETA